MPGQVGQSRNSVPGSGVTTDATAGAAAGVGAGARWAKNRKTNTSTRMATTSPAAGAITPRFQNSPRLDGGDFALRAARSGGNAARGADCRAANGSIFADGAGGRTGAVTGKSVARWVSIPAAAA